MTESKSPLQKRLESLEAGQSVPGTMLVRVLGEHGPQWSLGVGGLLLRKTFYVADTIEEVLVKAEADL